MAESNPDAGGIGGLFSSADNWLGGALDTGLKYWKEWTTIEHMDDAIDLQKEKYKAEQAKYQPAAAPVGSTNYATGGGMSGFQTISLAIAGVGLLVTILAFMRKR